MNPGKRNDDNGERGAVAVEFALIIPLLLILVSGIIETSTAFNRQQGLHTAALQGARLGSIPTATSAQITSTVQDALTGVTVSNPVINIMPSGPTPCADAESVVVTVSSVNQLQIAFVELTSIEQVGRGEFSCER